MILSSTVIIIISASSGLTLGSICGFLFGDRRRRNIERDRHYEDLVYHFKYDTPSCDYDITETSPYLK